MRERREQQEQAIAAANPLLCGKAVRRQLLSRLLAMEKRHFVRIQTFLLIFLIKAQRKNSLLNCASSVHIRLSSTGDGTGVTRWWELTPLWLTDLQECYRATGELPIWVNCERIGGRNCEQRNYAVLRSLSDSFVKWTLFLKCCPALSSPRH